MDAGTSDSWLGLVGFMSRRLFEGIPARYASLRGLCTALWEPMSLAIIGAQPGGTPLIHSDPAEGCVSGTAARRALRAAS